MKKRMLLLLVAFALLVSVAGCAKKTSVHISLVGMDGVQVTQIPEKLENYSVEENEITVTVKQEGDYTFVVEDEDGNEYTLLLHYYDGKAEVSSEDGIMFITGVG
ncbi:MAG: DUF3872 domain-containing protein [Oscillospiraceae bacterium]|nr:DUF3872 domain-containing protein [Oscillospiraceae bacterium]